MDGLLCLSDSIAVRQSKQRADGPRAETGCEGRLSGKSQVLWSSDGFLPKMAAAMPEPNEFAKTSHDFALWMIGLADTKANILVAASAILAGLLVPQALRTTNELAQVFLSLGAGIALVSAGLSLVSVFPRTSPEEHASLLYFTSIRKFKSWEEYHAKLLDLKPGESTRELARQTWELAYTQTKKFGYLRAGIASFGLCIAATLVGVLLSLLPIK